MATEPSSEAKQDVLLGLRDARETLAPAQALLAEAINLLEQGDDTAAWQLVQSAFGFMNGSLPQLRHVELLLDPHDPQ